MRIISLIVLTFAATSCSVTRMSDVFPESCGTDYGQIVIDDHDTSYTPLVGGKSSIDGHYGSVVGVKVHNQVSRSTKLHGTKCGGHCGGVCGTGSCLPGAGSAFSLGGTMVLDPYTTSAHYGLGGNVGMPGFATLPYTTGIAIGGHYGPSLKLNSASGTGYACGKGACAKPKVFTSRKVVKKQTEQQNYEIQK